MTTSQQKELLEQVDCEVCFDGLTRQLYATDASIYQLEPFAVAFPRGAEQASAVMRAAHDSGISITSRGGGTGLAGGALGSGLVTDFARYNRRILGLNRETNTVRVEPGVILDQLNKWLQPYGLCFGPDVATSSRATLGGMISTNSSGARAPLYGTTVDHVASLEVVLADGRISTVGAGHDNLPEQREAVDRVVRANAGLIRDRFPSGLLKRWPGYGLDRYMGRPGDLTQIIGGSEGTLAAIVSAELSLDPLPRQKGLALLFFASVMEAMEATVELLDLKPVAIEHIDRPLFDQTAGQRSFKAARDMLRLDDQPCESILLVEFYEDVADRLRDLGARNLGLRSHVCRNEDEMTKVWALRKAGLSLLTSRKGPAKPAAGLEDAAVTPRQLPAYIEGLRSLLDSLGLESSFYGHCASGLVHFRPVVDLRNLEDITKFRGLAEGVSELVRQFNGSLCSEHGVGIARAEFMEDHLGAELMEAMVRVKGCFDPGGLMNPGKVIPDGRYRIDTNLRQGPGTQIRLDFEPVLAFASRDESFTANLEQCNGCGECTKQTPTMCPTYIATGDDSMSTRGRANTIRAVLDGRISGRGGLPGSDALEHALSNCLACKACKTECPSNVDMALLKAELDYARKGRGLPHLLDWVISSLDLLGKACCMFPRLANAGLESAWLRKVMEKVMGISAKRPLPRYATQRFDNWFVSRTKRSQSTRGAVILWDDCFVRYNEPNVGKAATEVLEAAGFGVTLLEGRACCGRPAFSRGRLGTAKRLGKHNVTCLIRRGGEEPIVFLEPSCYSMFVEDYRELRVPGADLVARRCVLFEEFLCGLLEREPNAINFTPGPRNAAIHAHCHAKALTDVSVMTRLVKHMPDTSVTLLDTGCCGMAGAFGALQAKYELSLKVAEPLVAQINALGSGTHVIASGTSCRQQIRHLTSVTPEHMAEFLGVSVKGNGEKPV